MQVSEGEQVQHDGLAIALGCLAGLVAGAALGGGLMMMLGDDLSGMGVIVMVHSILAMMVMGGWTAPSLLTPAKSPPDES